MAMTRDRGPDKHCAACIYCSQMQLVRVRLALTQPAQSGCCDAPTARDLPPRRLPLQPTPARDRLMHSRSLRQDGRLVFRYHENRPVRNG